MNIPVIPQDKANHILYGQGIYGSSLMVLHHFVKIPLYEALGWAMVVTMALALGKEAWDRYRNKEDEAEGRPKSHSVEAWDAVATGLGGASLWVLTLVTWSM